MKTNTGETESRSLAPVIETLPDEKSRETAEIMRRFNEVFLRHDPSELKNLVAESCVIEKITPGPDGDRWVGRDACIAKQSLTGRRLSSRYPDAWSVLHVGCGTLHDLSQPLVPRIVVVGRVPEHRYFVWRRLNR